MSKILGTHIPTKIQNLVVNGGFDFFQEKVTNVTTVNTASSTQGYGADIISVSSSGSTTKNYSYTQTTDVPTPLQSGFASLYGFLFTMITGIASPAATDIVIPFRYTMEGKDFAKIHQKTATFGFWIKASVAGAYSLCLRNGAGSRSYVTTFVVNGANTHEFKSVSVPMDQVGTWVFDNTAALNIEIGAISGSGTASATLNSWVNGTFTNAVIGTVVNWMATSGATIRISQFSVVEGPLGFSATGFQRAGATIQEEFAMLQRYYEKSFPVDLTPQQGGNGTSFATNDGLYVGVTSNTLSGAQVVFKVPKRATPTWQQFGNNVGQYRVLNPGAASVTWSTNSAVLDTVGLNSAIMSQQVLASTLGSISTHWTADARL